jgi:hypothetical protein
MRHTVSPGKSTILLTASLALALMAGKGVAEPAPDMQELQRMMQAQIQLMQPQLQKSVAALSPETKQLLMKIHGQHNRHSDHVTLRQVMHEVLSDYNGMVSGVVTDNREQAADSARRLANHRIPRGGLLPYLKLELITDDKLAALASFNDSVEGNAVRLAQAAERGEMAKAGALVGDITAGCVGCHNVFRGVPGTSALLR